MFSGRSRFETSPHRVARALAQARAEGRPLLDLTQSNPTQAGLPYDEAAIREAIADPGIARYEPHPFGLPAARGAVAAHLGADPERLVLTASTSEAYAYLFKLLCDPGDEVLVPQPSYPLLEVLAQVESVRLAPYRLAYDGEWHIDLHGLRGARTHRTRAVVVVSPNNPTGSVLGRDELAAIASLGLPIISDEVFSQYAFGDDGRRARTALEAADALVFALGGLSKEAALPQMKLGWMTVGGPPAAAHEALGRLEHIADAFLSVATPVQLAAGRLLEATAITRAAIKARTRRNLSALRGRLGPGSPADVLRVEGGWYAVVRVPRTADEEQWVLALLDAGVVVQPGWFYDFPEPAYLVLSLLPPEMDFDEAADRLARVIQQHA